MAYKLEYWKAFKKPSKNVIKLFIGIILSSVPIVRWISKGYIIECSGVGVEKPSDEMPDWKNYLQYLVKGLVASIIILVYNLPSVLVIMFSLTAVLSGMLQVYTDTVIPPALLSVKMLDEETGMQILQIMFENVHIAIPYIYKIIPLILLTVAFKILASYISPMAVLIYLNTGNIKEAFHLKTVLKLVSGSDYMKVWLSVIAYSILVSLLLGSIPIVGFGSAYFIVGVYSYSLYGTLYRKKSII